MYNYDLGEQFLRSFIMVYVFFIIMLMIAGIALYILRSAGLYKMAKNRGMDNAWAAWIPYARVYIQGEIAGTVKIGRKAISHPGIWMLVIPFVSGIIISVMYIAIIAGAVIMGIAGMGETGFLFAGTFPGILLFIVLLVTLASVVLMAAKSILVVFVNRQIYGQMKEESAALFHAAAGLFIPGYESVCIFLLRNKMPENKPAEIE